MAVWYAVAGVLGVIGFVFVLVGAVHALTPQLGPAVAAAAVGGGVLFVALVAAIIARPRPVVRRSPLPSSYMSPPVPPVPPAASVDPSAMRSDTSGKTAMAITGVALLAGLVLGRRL